MKAATGIFGAMILSLAIAGSALAAPGGSEAKPAVKSAAAKSMKGTHKRHHHRRKKVRKATPKTNVMPQSKPR